MKEHMGSVYMGSVYMGSVYMGSVYTISRGMGGHDVGICRAVRGKLLDSRNHGREA